MGKKRVRRSRDEHYRKMMFFWIIALFFLALLVVLDFITAYSQLKGANSALNAELDYSKIHFEGLAIGQELPSEVREHQVIDADFGYSWNNIAISTDNNGFIDQLAFYTTGTTENGGATINDVSIDYRGYPLKTITDFAMYFGQTKILNFDHYKYLKYGDDHYSLDLTMMDNEVYNVILYKK